MTDAIDEAKYLVKKQAEAANAALLEKLKAVVSESNVTHVAARLDIPRCTLSLVVNDKYPANPKNILAKFESVYSGVQCPHLQADLTRQQCREYATKSRPSNPLGLQHWRACQNCPHKGG